MVRFQRTAAAGALAVGALLLGTGGGRSPLAQMHKVQKPESVVRAVGVYEWTGELTKPTASRLIPITVFIDGDLRDAAVYQPRPIPFALTPGNLYELQQAGTPRGVVDLSFARHLATADERYDDGWFGYGSYKAQSAEPKPKLRVSKITSDVSTGKDDGKPHFGGGSRGGGSSDPDSNGGERDGNKPDPDRPTLRRRSSTPDAKPTSGKNSAPDATPASAPAEDPDRPVLKRHDPTTDAKSGAAAAASAGDEAAALNSDPNRPTLHRGRPAGGAGGNAPDAPDMLPNGAGTLSGLPADLHQMVAVSDAANRPEHTFVRAWTDDAERTAVLAKMEALARAKLAGYGTAETPSAPAAATAPGAPPPAHPATTPAARRRAALAAAAAKKKAAAAGPVLLEGRLNGFSLSYGGAPTFVYEAHTDGTGAALRYVTVVAQQDVFGQLQTAFSNVTDATHLDRTPWMRLVDVVDVEASNRASLLFELREQGSRQFALYRVLGARSEPIFTTGTTQ